MHIRHALLNGSSVVTCERISWAIYSLCWLKAISHVTQSLQRQSSAHFFFKILKMGHRQNKTTTSNKGADETRTRVEADRWGFRSDVREAHSDAAFWFSCSAACVAAAQEHDAQVKLQRTVRTNADCLCGEGAVRVRSTRTQHSKRWSPEETEHNLQPNLPLPIRQTREEAERFD